MGRIVQWLSSPALLAGAAWVECAVVSSDRLAPRVSWEELLEILDRYDTPRRVKQEALQYAQNALKCLEIIPESPYKRALSALPDFVVNREN